MLELLCSLCRRAPAKLVADDPVKAGRHAALCSRCLNKILDGPDWALGPKLGVVYRSVKSATVSSLPETKE